MNQRPRRLRRTQLTRDMVADTVVKLSSLIQPYFLSPVRDQAKTIEGFDGQCRWGVDALSKRLEGDIDRGLSNFILFGAALESQKDREGRSAYLAEALVPEALRQLRSRFANAALFFSDVCLCPYTDHGHCGILKDEVENDLSLEPLAKMAVTHAQAGADWVAPSDMMDGRVHVIRKALDAAGFPMTGILAYSAKYASAYYGPFRNALGSAPKSMSRASYQMDYRNRGEALRELELDTAEGADMVMVKPAIAYLDIIRLFADHSRLPVAAYSVSGEYQMVKLLARSGMADERSLVVENLTAIRRAGAKVIITYHASEIAEKGWLRE